MAPVGSRQNEDAFDRAIGYFDESKTQHSAFVQQLEGRYKSWRGVLDSMSDAAQWTSKLHPPYINHIIETAIAAMVDDKLRYKIRPRLTLDAYLDSGAAERARAGAVAHQIMFDFQMRSSGFSDIQRPFVLQNHIAGITAAKTFWETRRERRRHLVASEEPLLDGNGEPLIHAATGQPLTMPKFNEQVSMSTVYDGPQTEVVDMRDFGWNESAISLSRARFVWHRVWVTPEEVYEGFAGDNPVYGPDRGGWSEKEVREAVGTGGGARKDEFGYREQELWSADRTKGLVELLEVWDNVRKERTAIVNRCALLAHGDFPFFHERAPFVVCSTQPDLFRIGGLSTVEKIAHLQEMLWTLQNQRLDNLQLINNAIFLFRPDIEDINDYVFEPGARWPVEDPTQVQMWTPNVVPAEVSIQGEGLLKGDIQNLAGGFPFSSGADSQNVDQKTATGAALITNIAQKGISLAKGEVYKAWTEVGSQRMVLNQQFIRTPTMAFELGVDNEEVERVIYPELLSGDFSFECDPESDSLMKQEEQASANAILQLLAQTAPILVPLAQAGMAKMINFDALIEDTLRAYGKDDVDRYFVSAAPPPVQAQGGGMGTPPQGAPAPAEPAQGVTASQSVDGATSPSASISVAPSVLIQRALAQSKGAGRNV